MGPDLATATKLFSSDSQFSCFFGIDVAIDGDVLVAGASFFDLDQAQDTGAAYVFARQDGQPWRETQRLGPASLGRADYFGDAVALSGDTMAIGAPSSIAVPADDDGRGAVYIYGRGDGQWDLAVRLVPDDLVTDRQFGRSVDLQGDLLVVGAAANREVAAAVYVFRRTGGVWAQEAKLEGDVLERTGDFGASIALDGERVFVGAPKSAADGAINVGAVYIFERVGPTWARTAVLMPQAPEVNLSFGISVAARGGVLAVGVTGQDDFRGRVAMFHEGGDGWVKVADLTIADALRRTIFGKAVALDGDRVFAGGIERGSAPGFVQRFDRDDATYSSGQRVGLDPELIAGERSIGDALAISGSTLVIGAPTDDGQLANNGAIYVVDVSP